MDVSAIWRNFQDGTSSYRAAFFLAAFLAASAFAVGVIIVRPLIRTFSKNEPEKVRQSRYRRITAGVVLTALSLGFYVFLHSIYWPDERGRKMGYQVNELLLFVFTGYVTLEVLLGFFVDYIPRLRGHAPLAPILKDLLRAVVLLAIFILGLKHAFPDADIGALVTTSAILSVVIGLALQESLSNIFSGLMLTIDHPFKPGDWIQVDGQEGKVLDSNWRSTRVHTRDDDIIYVPNSTMAKGNIMNLTDPTPDHLVRIRVGVDYAAPPNKVRSVLINVMLHVEGVKKEPAPDVFLVDFGDSAIVYELRYWIEEYDRRPRVDSEVRRGVWYHLKREGISIPFPIREVYLHRHKEERRPEEIIGLLRRVDILQPLKEDDVVMLAEDLSHHLYAKGEAICRQGEPGSTFYIIKSGTIGVRVKGEGGVDAEVARLQPGSYFGEMSLLTGEPRSSTCTALEDCELLCLDRESFAVLLQENIAVAQAMSDILAARSQATQARLTLERETVLKSRPPEVETGSRRILEKIRSIFGFKK